jgi:hypothetical protein
MKNAATNCVMTVDIGQKLTFGMTPTRLSTRAKT